jgi:hypothetical protein
MRARKRDGGTHEGEGGERPREEMREGTTGESRQIQGTMADK